MTLTASDITLDAALRALARAGGCISLADLVDNDRMTVVEGFDALECEVFWVPVSRSGSPD